MPRRKEKGLVHLDLKKLAQETAESKQKHVFENDELFLGGVLRQARMQKGLSLQDVSKALKIKEIYLQALENGQYYAFPGLAYGVGFLRTYARFLNLDAKQMVARFYEETSGIKTEPLEMPVVQNKNSLPSWALVGRSLLLVGVFYLAWYLIAFALESGQEAVTLSPEEGDFVSHEILNQPDAARGERIPAERVLPGVTSDTLVETLTAQPDAALNQEISSLEPITGKALPAFKTYGLEKPADLSFIAVQQTTVEVKQADETLFKGVLQPGDQYNAPAQTQGLRLIASHPEALAVFIGAAPQGMLSTQGKAGAEGYDLALENFKKR